MGVVQWSKVISPGSFPVFFTVFIRWRSSSFVLYLNLTT